MTNEVNPSGVRVVPQLQVKGNTGDISNPPDKDSILLVNPEDVIHLEIHGT